MVTAPVTMAAIIARTMIIMGVVMGTPPESGITIMIVAIGSVKRSLYEATAQLYHQEHDRYER